jgi:methionyl-tRNA formyltransferase
MPKKLIFMGTPKFAATILQALLDTPHELIAVVTQPDRPFGRHQELKASEVKLLALKHNLPIYQPEKIGLLYDMLVELKPDLIVTCAYGQFIPQKILQLPSYGAVNIHASLLPKYRGGAPIHWSIIRGEQETGITLMRMVKEMDAGDILFQESLEISDEDDVGSLHDKLAVLGASMIKKHMSDLLQDELPSIPQDPNLVSFAYTIQKQDEWIQFDQKVQDVLNRIRGLYPWPVGYLMWKDKRLKVFRAKAGPKLQKGRINQMLGLMEDSIAIQAQDGIVLLLEVQLEGRKRMLAHQFYKGLNEQLMIKDGCINEE